MVGFNYPPPYLNPDPGVGENIVHYILRLDLKRPKVVLELPVVQLDKTWFTLTPSWPLVKMLAQPPHPLVTCYPPDLSPPLTLIFFFFFWQIPTKWTKCRDHSHKAAGCFRAAFRNWTLTEKMSFEIRILRNCSLGWEELFADPTSPATRWKFLSKVQTEIKMTPRLVYPQIDSSASITHSMPSSSWHNNLFPMMDAFSLWMSDLIRDVYFHKVQPQATRLLFHRESVTPTWTCAMIKSWDRNFLCSFFLQLQLSWSSWLVREFPRVYFRFSFQCLLCAMQHRLYSGKQATSARNAVCGQHVHKSLRD